MNGNIQKISLEILIACVDIRDKIFPEIGLHNKMETGSFLN